MPPKNDICVALKKFSLSARTVNVPDKQFLLLFIIAYNILQHAYI